MFRGSSDLRFANRVMLQTTINLLFTSSSFFLQYNSLLVQAIGNLGIILNQKKKGGNFFMLHLCDVNRWYMKYSFGLTLQLAYLIGIINKGNRRDANGELMDMFGFV